MSFSVRLLKDSFNVREKCDIEIEIISQMDLGVGDTLEAQFPNSWSLISGPSHTRAFQAEDQNAEHFICVSPESGSAKFDIGITPRNLPFEEGKARHGRLLKATLAEGIVKAGERFVFAYRNTYAPYIAGVEKIWLRLNGEAPDAEPELEALPGPVARMRISVPSGAKPGEKFDVRMVSLDEFENCSSSSFKGKTLFLGGKPVANDLNFTGSLKVPFSISEEGIFRFRFDDALSNPIMISENKKAPRWGDIHIHTKLSMDAQGEDPYPYARDVACLDFAAAIDHWQSLGDIGYEILEEWAENSYEPGMFVTIPGDERNPEHMGGHHNVYFRDMEYLMANKVHPSSEPGKPVEPWKDLDKERAMIIPHHTGIAFGSLPKEGLGGAIVWDSCDDKGLRPCVEIYSHHGQSELYNPQHALAYEFNRMRNPERRANTSVPGPCYVQDYWMQGKKVGIIASSDQHTGQGGLPHGGIAAVYADSLTREGIFDALKARRSYATTGEKILIDFEINGVFMGETLKAEEGGELDIRLKVWGTNMLVRVDILRFRFGVDASFAPVLSEAPRPESMDAEFELKESVSGSCMYYARIVQEPLKWPDMAWTTPIWIEV